MKKERFDIIASSLSSYFGVGFLEPMEQLDVDLGNEERVFDEVAQDRMNLGNAMEDSCMNYFEQKMGIKIDERNSEFGYAVNGLLKCKRDGRTFIDGVETGWENKYSNAYSDFTNDLGYMLQCQAYMMAWDLDQWVLSGMWQGTPVYKLIKKDEEIQKDIETMVIAVSNILNGIADRTDFPWSIVEKYANKKQLTNIENIETADENIFSAIGQLKDQKKEIDDKLKELEDYVKETFADSKYENKTHKFSITTSAGRSSFDKHAFSIENPSIDLTKYEKQSAPYRMIRVTRKKGA